LKIRAGLKLFIIGIVLTLTVNFQPISISAQAVDPTDQTITFWHPHTSEREIALNALVARFNDENEWGITVEPRSLQNSGLLYDQIVLQLVAAPENRTLPNIFVAMPYETAMFALGGLVLDLNTFIEDETWGFSPNDFLPDVSNLGHDPFTNTQLGWPERIFSEVLYVNLTVLNDLGIENPPTTYAEFQAAACQFFEENQTPALLLETNTTFISGLIAANGGSIFDNAAYTLDTPQMRKAIEWLSELLNSGCAALQTTPYAAQDEFMAGRTLFYFGSTSALSIIHDGIQQNPFEWDVFAILGTNSRPYLTGPTLSIFSQNPEADLAAWLFLRWWVAEWSQTIGSLPIQADLSLDNFADFPQWQSAWELVNQGGVIIPAMAAHDVVRLEIDFAVQRMLNDPSDIDEELLALDGLANKILVDFRK
jgi:ABC-type glycerol-3-phosphate transport system substrate-binding protein